MWVRRSLAVFYSRGMKKSAYTASRMSCTCFASGVTVTDLRTFFDTITFMNSPILTVVFYRADSGNEPVRQWLRDMTAEDRKTIGTDIKTVQYGWPLGMPLVRKMEADIWEVRCNIASGIARVLFTTLAGQIVLLHGFIKKSQKTSSIDLKTARDRLKKLKAATL